MIRIMIFMLLTFVLGFAAAILPRFYDIDPMTLLRLNVKKATAAETKASKPDSPELVVVPKDRELRKMISEVNAQRQALCEREKPLAEAAAKIEQERKALHVLRQEVESAEQRVKASLLEVEANEAVNLKKLAKTWAQMDPLETAKLIKSLEPDFSVKILSRMTERQAAAVLGAMTADVGGEKLAATITNKLKQVKQGDLKSATPGKDGTS